MCIECAYDENNDILPVIVPLLKKPLKGFLSGSMVCQTNAIQNLTRLFVGIYCKLQIYAIRFCLIIQMARWACNDAGKDVIDLISVERAITLAEYFMRSQPRKFRRFSKSLRSQHSSWPLSPPYLRNFTTGSAIAVAAENGMSERALMEFLKELQRQTFSKVEAWELYQTLTSCSISKIQQFDFRNCVNCRNCGTLRFDTPMACRATPSKYQKGMESGQRLLLVTLLFSSVLRNAEGSQWILQ